MLDALSTAPLPHDQIQELLRMAQRGDVSALEHMLYGMQTHNYESSSIHSTHSDGKVIIVTRRLFSDLDGKPVDLSGVFPPPPPATERKGPELPAR